MWPITTIDEKKKDEQLDNPLVADLFVTEDGVILN